MSPFDFNNQVHQGTQGEYLIDRFFSQWYTCEQVSQDWQRMGIDRVLVNKRTGQRNTIEYKTDFHQTGNVFIETVSVSTQNKPGWIYTSQAQYLAYWLLKYQKLYITTLDTLRAQLPRWEAQYRLVDVPNDSYITRGLIVPIVDFAKCTALCYDLRAT